MEERKTKDDINQIKSFEKVVKDIELKLKEIYINNFKIKDNLRSMKRIENKHIFLDDIISDKKSELNILKHLIILKEQKKLNFEDIISKYLYHLILIDDKNNNKIDDLKKNDFIIKKKTKIINKIFENVNNEFNHCLNDDIEDNIKNKLISYNKNIKKINNNKNYYLPFPIEKNIYSIDKESNSCKNKKINSNLFKNGKYSFEQKNIHSKKEDKKQDNIEIEQYINNIQKFLNKNKLNKCKNKDNNIEQIDKDKINNINKNNKEELNLNYDKKINVEENKNNNINNNNENIKNNLNSNILDNQIVFKANKNLQKSRENLKTLLLQNDKEKLNNRKKENFISFVKLVLSKLENYHIIIKKLYFNKILKYNALLNLKNIINKFLMKNIIFKKLKGILKELSSVYNEAINEEISDDEFLNNIDLDQNINIKYSLKYYENNLNKIKNINKEIKDIENKIQIFANKVIDSH